MWRRKKDDPLEPGLRFMSAYSSGFGYLTALDYEVEFFFLLAGL